MRSIVVVLAAIASLSLAAQAFADPPPWAPAHGWRDKHDDEHEHEDEDEHEHERGRYYVGYSGAEYDRDFDINRGRCNREQVGAVLGGVVGGVIGNQVGNRDDRVVATIIGAAIGALVGAKIGRDMDDGDRACFGHALELGVTGRPVIWTNESNHVRYQLVPGDGSRDGGRVCRRFTLLAVDGRDRVTRKGMACQTSRGVWELARR